MRVTDRVGNDTEAIPMGEHGGSDEFWLCQGLLLDRHELHRHFTPQPERRAGERRTDSRRADQRRRERVSGFQDANRRTVLRRQACRRLRDSLTTREVLDLARGPQWTAP